MYQSWEAMKGAFPVETTKQHSLKGKKTRWKGGGVICKLKQQLFVDVKVQSLGKRGISKAEWHLLGLA